MLYSYSVAQNSTISNKVSGENNNYGNKDIPGSAYKSGVIAEGNINRYNISTYVTTHFVSPEPIVYVDISPQNVEGDLPENLL